MSILAKEREHYAPDHGIDLEHYIKTENKQGVHHSIRYLWAIEVIKNRPNVKRVLDLGCGEGFGANAVAQAFSNIEVLAVDYDEKSSAQARERYTCANLNFETADVRDPWTSFGEEEFDLILSFDVIEHVEHRELMMHNITRALNKQGALFLSTPCGKPRPTRVAPGWEHHKIEYNSFELYDFVRRYFEVVRRPDDQQQAFPGISIFDRLRDSAIDYLLVLNPIICEQPIRLENPYVQLQQSLDKEVAFSSSGDRKMHLEDEIVSLRTQLAKATNKVTALRNEAEQLSARSRPRFFPRIKRKLRSLLR